MYWVVRCPMTCQCFRLSTLRTQSVQSASCAHSCQTKYSASWDSCANGVVGGSSWWFSMQTGFWYVNKLYAEHSFLRSHYLSVNKFPIFMVSYGSLTRWQEPSTVPLFPCPNPIEWLSLYHRMPPIFCVIFSLVPLFEKVAYSLHSFASDACYNTSNIIYLIISA